VLEEVSSLGRMVMKRLTKVLLALILGLASVSVRTPLVPSQGSYVYDLVLEWGGYGDHDGHFYEVH
jgi:hypothetical protein